MNSTQEVNRLFKENYPLVKRLAIDYFKNYKGNKLDLDDFIQESSIQSLKYLKRYNPNKGKVSTFLKAYVGKALIRYSSSNLYSITLPAHIIDRVRLVSKLSEHTKITTSFLKERLKCTDQTAEVIDTIINGRLNFSLDSVREEISWNLSDKKNNVKKLDESIDINQLVNSLDKLLKTEDKRNIKIFKQYYLGEGKQTLEKISKQYGVTKQCIYSVLQRCLKKVKHKLDIGVRIYE